MGLFRINALIGYIILVMPYHLLPSDSKPLKIYLKNSTLNGKELLLINTTEILKSDKVTTKPTIRTGQNSKKKITTPKPTQKATTPAIKEFHLQTLFEIGLRSNEANKFIRSRSILGKPLEEQYEMTRELDMNDLETKYAKDDGEARELMKSWKMGKV